MFLPWHNNDFRKLPEEDKVMAALRPFGIPLGEYVMPQACNNSERREQAFKDKVNAGPVAFLSVLPSDYGMGKSLSLWFLYCVGIGVFAAYIASRALAPGADCLEVFRFAGAAAFGGYALGLAQNSIWYHRAWSSTFKSMADGLAYALLTGAVFCFLWPAQAA
jgi:hypothetical protein